MQKKSYTKEIKQHRNKKYIIRNNGCKYQTEIMALQKDQGEPYFFYSSIFFDWTRYVDMNVPFPEYDYNSFNYSTVISDLCHKMRKEFVSEYPTVICILKFPEKFTTTSKLDKTHITVQLCVPLPKEKKLETGLKAQKYYVIYKDIIDHMDKIIDSYFNP